MSQDLSLQEAAELFDLSLRTLGQRIRNGEIAAYKSEGRHRGERRIRRKDLEAFGYKRRADSSPSERRLKASRTSEQDSALGALEKAVRRLERRVASAERSAATHRRRAEESDRLLAEALVEVGRLRAALAAETSRRVHAELSQDD